MRAPSVTTEQLLSWDGLTGGIGPMETLAPTVPSGTYAGTPMSYTRGAVAFDDHAVVMTDIPGEVPPAGVALSQLDLRGRTISLHSFRLPGTVPEILLRVGNELRLIGNSDAGIFMLSFDGAGRTMLSSHPVVLATGRPGSLTDSTSVKAASDGHRIWVLWLDPDAESTDGKFNVTLATFDASGRSLAPPIVLQHDAFSSGVSDLTLSVSSSRVMATWRSNSNFIRSQHYAVIDAASAAVIGNRTLLRSRDYVAPLVPVVLGSTLTAFWDGVPSDSKAFGVQFDPALEPVLPPGQSPARPVVTPPWMERVQAQSERIAATDHGVISSSNTYNDAWPDYEFPTAYCSVSELVPQPNVPLSLTEPRLLARVTGDLGNVQQILTFKDRVMLLGDKSNHTLTTTVVWLHL